MGRILVIDDSVEMLRFFTSVLESSGHEVLRALDGEEGLQRFRDELPDLVFLDLLLPRKDGSEVCAEIKSTEQGLITPLALMTGVYKTQSKVEMMRSYGAVDLLLKPVPVEKITALVEWVLNGKPSEDAAVSADPELERLDLAAGTDGVPGGAEATPLDLLRRAWEERLTGVLAVGRGRLRRALAVEDGLVFSARSNVAAERIERILLAMRKITPVQMSQLKAGRIDPSLDVLEAFERMGAFVEGGRDQAIRLQAMTIGLALARTLDGTARFFPGETVAGYRLDQPIHPGRLGVIALRKNPALRQAVARGGFDGRTVFERNPGPGFPVADGDLTRRERDVLDQIDGSKTVEELREVGELAALAVDDTMALLAGAGLVRQREPGAWSAAEWVSRTRLAASGDPVAGDLAACPFVEVLGRLMRQKATGLLTVEGAVRRSFAFARGELVFARSGDLADRLGNFLLAERRIDRATLDRALQLQAEQRPHRRLGAILVDMGALSLGTLLHAVRLQTMCIVESTFPWSAGTFSFQPTAEGLGAAIRMGLRGLDLLRLGVARMDDAQLRRRWLEGDDEVVLLPAGEDSDIAMLSPLEQQIVELVRGGPAGAQELFDAIGRLDGVALRAVELVAAHGLVQVERRARPRTPSQAPKPAAVAAPRPEPAPPVPRPAPPSPAFAPPARAPEQADTLEITVLEPEAGPLAPSAAPAGDILSFLRDELVADRRTLERELREVCVELGALRERVRALEAENARLRAAPPRPAPANAVEAAPPAETVPAEPGKPRAPARKRSRGKGKTEPAPVPPEPVAV